MKIKFLRMLDLAAAALLSVSMFSFMIAGEVRGGSKMTLTKKNIEEPHFQTVFTDYHDNIYDSFLFAKNVVRITG